MATERKPDNLRVKHFMGGRMSPEDFHRANAFPRDAKCTGCGTPKVAVRAITMAPLADAVKNWKGAADMGPREFQDLLQLIVQLKGSDGQAQPYVRLGIVYSCPACRPAFEKELARLPSWVVVDISAGPGPDKPVVQVA